MGKKSTRKQKYLYLRNKKAIKQLMQEHEMGLIDYEEFVEEANKLW